jgi:Domain of unknown function (DUF4116)
LRFRPGVESKMGVVFVLEVYSDFTPSKPAWCPYVAGFHVMKKRDRPHAARHAWALEMYGHLLSEALRKDTSAEAREVEKMPVEQLPGLLVSLILERADPTQNKGMTAWLVGQYAQGRLRLEDLGTANETLTMFRRYAQRLDISQRDLGQYQSLAAVWNAVIGFANDEEQRLSGKAQKALDRDKAYAESRILRQDPDGFTIAVPLTEFAAKWWGKGTRWCTAAEKDNKFRQYHKEAPLIVVVIPELKEKGKFQIWAAEDIVHFMDAADNPASEILITEYWTRFEPVISFALRQNGLALDHVPEKLRTEEICRIAVAQNGGALFSVPQNIRTDEMCRIAINQNGAALKDVPENLRTEEMCRIAVAKLGMVLYHVPQKLRTDGMCKIAVAQNGGALLAVPEKLLTEDICNVAVGQSGWALKDVREKLRTEELCTVAVKRYGLALQYVPEDLHTDALCRIAVAQNGLALQYVPQDLRTDDLCRIALAQNGWALDYVPEKLRAEDLCRIAVVQNGRALHYVPQKLRTQDLCRIAVAQDGEALEYVPSKLHTQDLCKIALAQNGAALFYVPVSLRSEDICRLAVAQDRRALEYVPEAMRDRISAFLPPPIPAWDISLLDELVSLLDATSSPAPSGARHA